MTEDNRILLLLGEMRGEHRAAYERLRSLETTMELVRQALQEQGKQIAALPCDARRKQISDLFKTMGKEIETTARIKLQMAEEKAVRRWWASFVVRIWDARAYWVPALMGIALILWALIWGK